MGTNFEWEDMVVTHLPIPLLPMILRFIVSFTPSLKNRGAVSLEILCHEPNLETICGDDGQSALGAQGVPAATQQGIQRPRVGGESRE